MYTDMHSFYTSREWCEFRNVVMSKRLNDNGELMCEHCGKPIVKAYDCILHHKQELTLENVNDVSVALNEDNILLVHHACHDEIHKRFGHWTRHIYLVYGSPLSGKSSYVKAVATKDDLVIDMDSIRFGITGGKLYERSNRVNDNVFAVRDMLLDMIKTRRGKWINAFIIGGYPLSSERERLANSLGAEVIYIDSTLDGCLSRLELCADGRDKVEWKKYIEEWWNRYSK